VYGEDDGKDLFDRLQEKVDQYNVEDEALRGRAFLQWHEAPVSETDDELEEKAPLAKKEVRRAASSSHLYTTNGQSPQKCNVGWRNCLL